MRNRLETDIKENELSEYNTKVHFSHLTFLGMKMNLSWGIIFSLSIFSRCGSLQKPRRIDDLSVLTIHQHTGPTIQFTQMHPGFVFRISFCTSYCFSLYYFQQFFLSDSQTLVVSISPCVLTDGEICSDLYVELAPSSIMALDARKTVGEREVPVAIGTTSSWSHQARYWRLCGSPIPAITHTAGCNL